MIRLQAAPIRLEELIEAVRGDEDGAVATFLGTVRDRSGGKRVLWLEYEAYGEMAERELERIAERARASCGARAIAVVHRTGRLEVGEVSVAIAAAAAHRAEAFAACRLVIEELKRDVPIWKREGLEDGAVWVGSGS